MRYVCIDIDRQADKDKCTEHSTASKSRMLIIVGAHSFPPLTTFSTLRLLLLLLLVSLFHALQWLLSNPALSHVDGVRGCEVRVDGQCAQLLLVQLLLVGSVRLRLSLVEQPVDVVHHQRLPLAQLVTKRSRQ